MENKKKTPKEGFEEVNSVDNAEYFNQQNKENTSTQSENLPFFERKWLREWLVAIKRNSLVDKKKFFINNGALFIILSLISVIVDMTTPFGEWWMITRTVIMMPMVYFGFNIYYAILFQRGQQLLREDKEWVPYRARFSPRSRLNFTFIAAAIVLLLIILFDEKFVGYTFFFSVIGIFVVGIVAFNRKTRSEQRRAELNLADPRDTMFEKRIEERQREREHMREMRKESDENIEDDERTIQSNNDKKK